MAITLKICEDEKEWESLLDKCPHGSIFHTWKFLKIIEKHTKSTLFPIIGLDGSEPKALYPLFYQRKAFLKMVFSPPPHCAVPYLGPVMVDYDKLKQCKREGVFLELQREVDKFISTDLKANYVFLSTPPGIVDVRPFKWTGYCVEPVYNYQTDLSKGIEPIWNNLKKKLRQNINKEKNSEVIIDEGSEESVDYIYDLLQDRYSEQEKVANVPREYLHDIFRTFQPENIKIFTVKYKDERVGGLIDLFYKGKASSWIGNTKPKMLDVDAIDILQWNAIKKAHERGYTIYEEVGANTERLCKYKAKFNPEPSLHFTAKKCDNRSYVSEKAYLTILKPLAGHIKYNKK